MKFCRACRNWVPNENAEYPACASTGEKHQFNYESSYEQAASERLRRDPGVLGQHLQETIRQAIRLEKFRSTNGR